MSGSSNRWAKRREVGERSALDEPLDAEVGWMDAQNGRGAVADRQCVVVQSRPVCRAHFAQPRARLRHHIRHPEAAADLDQLASRHQHLAAARDGRQRQERRRRAIVHHDRRFGARNAAQQGFSVCRTRATRPGRQIELEIAVAGTERPELLDRRRSQWRASEVGVDDDAGGVDDGS